jgi:ABC-type multidrug transport system fused ATPase/permease subunit
MIIKYKPKVN